jgi:asparaginyl-tRNA synthetase
MTPRITIAQVSAHDGETVELAGWLYNIRKSGKIVFPLLRDGTGLIQCVAVKSQLPEDVFETIKDLTQESSLIITGKVRSDARATGSSASPNPIPIPSLPKTMAPNS